MAFDYNGPAEVFAGRSMRGPRPMRYQRFETGAEALRFAIEVLPRANLLGAILEAKDRKSTRLNSSHIQKSRMPSSA